MQEYLQRDAESYFDWKLRLILGKMNKDNDLDWVEIRDILGLECSSDHFRKVSQGIFEYHNNKINNQVYDADILTELEKRKIDLQKQQFLLSDQRREYTKLLRESARFDHLKEEIAKNIAILAQEKPLFFDPTPLPYSNREGVLLLSDWHLGMAINSYLNTFNKYEFDKRIKRLVQKTIEYGQDHQIKTLHCMILSDLVEGILRVKTRVANEEDIIRQVQIVSETLAEMLTEFANNFAEIKLYSVLDNHSRVTPQKEESLTSENFSYLITWYLEARLKDCGNIMLTINEYDDEIIVANICGQKIFAVHGHLDSNLSNIVQNLTLMIKEFPSYIFVGHTHKNFSDEIHGVEVIVNPSLSGASEYSKDIRKTSKPAQKLMIFDDIEGLLCTYSIRLDKLQLKELH